MDVVIFIFLAFLGAGVSFMAFILNEMYQELQELRRLHEIND